MPQTTQRLTKKVKRQLRRDVVRSVCASTEKTVVYVSTGRLLRELLHRFTRDVFRNKLQRAMRQDAKVTKYGETI